MNSKTSDGWRPLKGIKVIDFSMLLPGPLTTLILADLGAEVIKIEPPGGDYARHMKSWIFEGANRNKKSIELDMKSASSGRIVERLAARCDVAVEGFRPGVADKLGFGIDALRAINPRIVYCSISGFGQSGPDRMKPGHDLAYLAMGGAIVHKGQLGKQPARSSLPVADIVGGAYAAIAILAALRERDETGRGAALDLSLYESALYTSAVRFGFETPVDSVSHLYPANDLFRCADGRQLALTIVEPKFWDNFVEAISMTAPEFAAEQFATEAGRLENAEHLMSLLDDLFAQRASQDWVDFLESHDVPAAVCLTPAEAVKTDHAVARAMHLETSGGTVMPFPVIADGRHLPREQSLAPALGGDAFDILSDLGFEDAEIAQFSREGTVRLTQPASAHRRGEPVLKPSAVHQGSRSGVGA